MYISLIGSHCCGKTAVVKELMKRPMFSDYYIAPEQSRIVLNDGFKINENDGSSTQIAIFTHIMKYLQYDNVIFDRMMIDNLAYCHYQHRHGLLPTYVLSHLEKITEEILPKFQQGRIFYLSNLYPLIDDGERSMNEQFQIEVNYILQELLEKYGIIYTELKQNTPQEKADKIEYLVERTITKQIMMEEKARMEVEIYG